MPSLAQAERRGLSAFPACASFQVRRFRVRAGPLWWNAAPAGVRRNGARDRARRQPRSSFRGVAGCPRWGGREEDAQRLRPGRKRPPTHRKSSLYARLRNTLITWRLRGARQPLGRGVYLHL